MAIYPTNVLALCAGVGGLDLGVMLAVPGASWVCHVEGEGYVAAVLAARMEEGLLDQAPIWDNVATFDGKPWRGIVHTVTGGYPCQPFSHAGKMLADKDPRHLWPHVRRIVEEVQPQVCFFENVAHHLHLGFEQVHDDLQAMGFRVAAGVFSAEEVGASHKRERLFIMAHAGGKEPHRLSGRERADVLEARNLCRSLDKRGRFAFPPCPLDREAWAKVDRSLLPTVESEVHGVADGLAHRVDRLRACGNGVLPLVAAHAWLTLDEALNHGKEHS